MDRGSIDPDGRNGHRTFYVASARCQCDYDVASLQAYDLFARHRDGNAAMTVLGMPKPSGRQRQLTIEVL